MTQELRAGDPPRIGPYRLLGRLGAGGMGQVYLGRSAEGRLAAVKVIRPDLAAECGFRARFTREVAAARAVSGLFTALVLDADTDGPVPWLATAYVAGPSLADAVDAHGPLPAASVLTLAAGLAEGLAAVHAAGMVHRDVKPSNVLLAADGPRLIDFGISRAAGASALTQTGMVIGSPGFMSPEQATGGAVGPASDVFSLGAVLAFAATGEGPFGAGSTPALVYRVVHSTPEVTRLPGQIRPLVERCLAKDPAGRPTPAELLAGLGAGRRHGDWLPEPLTQVLGEYAPGGLAGTAGSPPPAGRLGPATVTAALARPATAGPSFPARPGAAGRRSPHRGRRGPAWALLAAGLIAAAAAALVVPRVLGDAPASHSERTVQARSALGSAPRPPQANEPASPSAPPGTVAPSPGTMAGSSDPAPTATAPGSPSASATPPPAPTTPAPTPTPTAAPTPSPTMTAPAPAVSPTPTTTGGG